LWSQVQLEIENTERAVGLIHKGALLFNTGLSHYLAGDFDRALQFVTAAGAQDEESGRGPASNMLTGANRLGEHVLLDPIAQWTPGTWHFDSARITTTLIVGTDKRRLLEWLSRRIPDLMQVVIALNRIRRAESGPDSIAVQHMRVRSVADLTSAFESTLRRWQPPTVTGQLYERLKDGSMLGLNAIALDSFDGAHDAFNAQFPKPDRETAAAVNWSTADCLQRIDTTLSQASNAGTACYLAYRLRNSLQHVLDEGLDLYGDRVLLLRVAGIMFACFELSRMGEDGSLATLR
jgi:hypothetical protein